MKLHICTRTALAVAALILTANPTRPQSSPTGANTNAASGDLIKEAQAVATQLAEREFRKCGQYYYTVFGEEAGSLYEFDYVTFGAKKRDDFSSADELAGYQWRGLATYTYSTYRIYKNGKWSQRMPSGGPALGPSFESIVKKNGQWMVDAYFLAKARDGDEERPVEMFLRQAALPPTCDAVPK